VEEIEDERDLIRFLDEILNRPQQIFEPDDELPWERR
jgi:hypothetical protein